MSKANESPSCPFCSFSVDSASDHDVHFLMQHLELCHPENGESPFMATNHDRNHDRGRGGRIESDHDQPYRSASLGRDSSASLATTTSDEDDEDDTYVDCPAKCGETVLVADLGSHMELHGTEDFNVEELDTMSGKDEWPCDYRGGERIDDQAVAICRQPIGGVTQLISPKSRSTTPDQTLDPTRQKRPRSSRSKRHKDEITFKDFKDLLLGRVSKRRSHKSTHSRSKRHSGVRRLGVNISHTLYYLHKLISPPEIRARAPCI